MPLMASISASAMAPLSQQYTTQELTNTLWAFAALKCRHDPLIASLAASALQRDASTQNMVNTAWACDVFGWPGQGPHRFQVLLSIIGRFMTESTGSLGVEWVTLAALAVENGVALAAPEFMASFQRRVLDPVCSHLSALRRGEPGALERMQDWILRTQTPHLGAFTSAALPAAGARSPTGASEWVSVARAEALSAVWWSCPHAAVSSQGVVAWLEAELLVDAAAVRLGPAVWLAGDKSGSILVDRMLRPLFLQVPRGSHAERQALLAVLRVVGRGLEDEAQVAGDVRLFASHNPCISCLAIIAQFCGRLPRVMVMVAFDNAWSLWRARRLTSQEGVLVIGRDSDSLIAAPREHPEY